MATTIEYKKNCIDKIKKNHFGKIPDSKIFLNMIYGWVKGDELNTGEFQELLNYCRQGISRNGKNPYSGNEDPEYVMG